MLLRLDVLIYSHPPSTEQRAVLTLNVSQMPKAARGSLSVLEVSGSTFFPFAAIVPAHVSVQEAPCLLCTIHT